jgi:hypothetical protein
MTEKVSDLVIVVEKAKEKEREKRPFWFENNFR